MIMLPDGMEQQKLVGKPPVGFVTALNESQTYNELFSLSVA
jgi:hypothetical protein